MPVKLTSWEGGSSGREGMSSVGSALPCRVQAGLPGARGSASQGHLQFFPSVKLKGAINKSHHLWASPPGSCKRVNTEEKRERPAF